MAAKVPEQPQPVVTLRAALLQPSAASMGLTAAVFEFIAAVNFAEAKSITMCDLQSEFNLRTEHEISGGEGGCGDVAWPWRGGVCVGGVS